MGSDIFISTAAFGGATLREIIARCEAHGVAHLELSSGVRLEADWRDIARAARDRGMRLLVHNYFPPPADPFVLNLAATDTAIRERSLAFCRDAIDLAAELGAPFYSVHSGFSLNLTPAMLGHPELQAAAGRIPRDAARATFLASVRELLPRARSAGIRLLVENNVLSPRYRQREAENPLLLCDAAEVLWLMHEVADPALGLLFDTGHAKVSATALGFDVREFVAGVAPHIGKWHVSDNDGITDQNRACREDSWFLPALRAHPAPVVIEVSALSPADILQQSALLRAALS
ncbi:MAG: sugar phosphate isomerase/epimerase family protein [Chthoniobacteraceae bacterium]